MNQEHYEQMMANIYFRTKLCRIIYANLGFVAGVLVTLFWVKW